MQPPIVDQIMPFLQVAVLVLNGLLVPIAFNGVKWLLRTEKRLMHIELKLGIKQRAME